jgi:hypothetical protein
MVDDLIKLNFDIEGEKNRKKLRRTKWNKYVN